jgi:Uma2 family endonuclease
MSVAPAASRSESTSIAQAQRPSAASNRVPAGVSGDILYEVIDGRIKEKIARASECEIASLLIGFLAPFVREHRLGKILGETLFRIDQAKDLQRRPDVAFVSHARWPFNRRAPKVAAWDMVPDLAIEVVSPSNMAVDLQARIHDYFRAGFSRVWVIYPGQKHVYVHASRTQIQVVQLGEELDGGELLPGFRLSLAALFEDDAD